MRKIPKVKRNIITCFHPWLVKILSVNTFNVIDDALTVKEPSSSKSESEFSNIRGFRNPQTFLTNYYFCQLLNSSSFLKHVIHMFQIPFYFIHQDLRLSSNLHGLFPQSRNLTMN